MFAIIDIETTGLDPQKDKITEIAVMVHDGLSVVERFSTLINPERSIPAHISRITGINDSMVKDAPKFFEVAKKILDLTRDRIFVAHNVEFDFRFVQEEFKSFGYPFKRDKLCTVRLSKKLLPKRKSYSLGRLCESLGIPLLGAHRASSDAEATAQLFTYLMQLKSAHPVYKHQDLDTINTGRVAKIQEYILKKLPEVTGVYRFLNKNREIIYIGKSNNIRQRAIQHYNAKDKKTRRMLGEIYNVEWEETGSELIALLLESEEIKRFKPVFNRARKRDLFSYAIEAFSNEQNIVNLKIVPREDCQDPIRTFHTWISARSFLNQWFDEGVACPKYCGFFDHEGPCFNFQIKKCHGICCDKESIEHYNHRLEEKISTEKSEKKDQIIQGIGRTKQEVSFVLLQNGKFSGYGFSHEDSFKEDMDFLLKRVIPFTYYPDADELITSFLKSSQHKQEKGWHSKNEISSEH